MIAEWPVAVMRLLAEMSSQLAMLRLTLEAATDERVLGG